MEMAHQQQGWATSTAPRVTPYFKTKAGQEKGMPGISITEVAYVTSYNTACQEATQTEK